VNILYVILQARGRLTSGEELARADEELGLDTSAAFFVTSCYAISQVHFWMLAGRARMMERWRAKQAYLGCRLELGGLVICKMDNSAIWHNLVDLEIGVSTLELANVCKIVVSYAIE
jgi:hypothetical protein